jgi:hypothetical protein
MKMLKIKAAIMEMNNTIDKSIKIIQTKMQRKKKEKPRTEHSSEVLSGEIISNGLTCLTGISER